MRWQSNSPEPTLETPEDPPEKHDRKNCSPHYFKYVLLVGYYTLVFPYKPTFNKLTNEYFLSSHPIQKPLCYISWTLALVTRLTTIRLLILTSRPSTPYFELAHSILHVIPYIIYFLTAHKSPSKFLTILNTTTTSPLLASNRALNRTLRTLIIVTQSLWFTITLASPIIGYETINSSCWSPSYILNAYSAQGKQTLFLSTSPNSTSAPNSALNITTCVFQITIQTCHVCLLFFLVPLIGNCSFTLYSASTNFHDLLTNPPDLETPLNIPECYTSLKSVTSSINSTFHLLSFWFVIDLTSWLSTELDSGLRSTDYFVRFHIFYYLAYICTTFCMSAEAFRKVEKLRSHFQRDNNSSKLLNENTSKEELDTILTSLATDVVGVGEVGFFRINYSFIGQITGLIITLYIISVDKNTESDEFAMKSWCNYTLLNNSMYQQNLL